jgi:hypothetical protein
VQLEQFLFEETCRLEQSAALMGRAREFLKEQRVLEPAEFRIARIVGEQRVRAREHIFRRVAASVPNGLAGTLEEAERSMIQIYSFPDNWVINSSNLLSKSFIPDPISLSFRPAV